MFPVVWPFLYTDFGDPEWGEHILTTYEEETKNGTDEEKKQRGWASQRSDFGETEYDFYFYFLKTLGSKFLTSVILNVNVMSDIVRYSRNWSRERYW